MTSFPLVTRVSSWGANPLTSTLNLNSSDGRLTEGFRGVGFDRQFLWFPMMAGFRNTGKSMKNLSSLNGSQGSRKNGSENKSSSNVSKSGQKEWNLKSQVKHTRVRFFSEVFLVEFERVQTKSKRKKERKERKRGEISWKSIRGKKLTKRFFLKKEWIKRKYTSSRNRRTTGTRYVFHGKLDTKLTCSRDVRTETLLSSANPLQHTPEKRS